LLFDHPSTPADVSFMHGGSRRDGDVVFQALTDVLAGTAPGPGVVSYDSYLG